MGGKDIINFLRINGLVGSGGGLDLEGHLVLRAIQVQEKMLPLSRHGHKTVGRLFWRGIGARKQPAAEFGFRQGPVQKGRFLRTGLTAYPPSDTFHWGKYRMSTLKMPVLTVCDPDRAKEYKSQCSDEKGATS